MPVKRLAFFYGERGIDACEHFGGQQHCCRLRCKEPDTISRRCESKQLLKGRNKQPKWQRKIVQSEPLVPVILASRCLGLDELCRKIRCIVRSVTRQTE
jgi:hypothetical protein